MRLANFGKLKSGFNVIRNVKPRSFSSNPDNFLTGANSIYVEQMYDAWLTDPKR